MFKALDNMLEKTSELLNYCRIGGMGLRLISVFADMVEYIHQISMYVFLDCGLPTNLKKLFRILY